MRPSRSSPVGLLLTVLAGCGSAAGSAAAPAPEAVRPSDLIGLWRTVGPGIAADTFLKLAADRQLFLFSPCGAPFGQWRAVPGGAFDAILQVAAPDCPAVRGDDEWERSTPEWLRSVADFRAVGADRELLDGAGRTVARLTATGTAPGATTPGAAMPGERVPPDPATPDDLARLDAGTPLPAGLHPATPTDLTGRWIPASGSAPGVFVDFAPNRSVNLHDGCNFSRGRWTLAADGAFASVLYLSYVVSCANAPAADWLQTANWLCLDGGNLVFVDSAGNRMGALRRPGAEQATAPPLRGEVAGQ